MNPVTVRCAAGRVSLRIFRRTLATYGVSVDEPSDTRPNLGESSSGPRRARVAPTPPVEAGNAVTDEPSLGKSDLLLDTPEKVRYISHSETS